jgi:hypothetical protein
MLPKPAPKFWANGRPRSKPMLNMEAALLRREMKTGAWGARVRGARVRGARVRGARVRGARVRGARVRGAVSPHLSLPCCGIMVSNEPRGGRASHMCNGFAAANMSEEVNDMS